MALSNAERQRRYRQRLKARAAIIPGAGLYDAVVEHLRAYADADGMVSRGFPPRKRQRLSPEDLAAEICLRGQEVFHGVAIGITALLPHGARRDGLTEEPAAGVDACLEKIKATLAPPDAMEP